LIVWQLCKVQTDQLIFTTGKGLAGGSGAEGDHVIAAAVDRLSKKFVVFHDFNVARGNFDHLVIGPSGIFAVETKNFRGTITADGQGELTPSAYSAVVAKSVPRSRIELRSSRDGNTPSSRNCCFRVGVQECVNKPATNITDDRRRDR
jgi:hypothetical protein